MSAADVFAMTVTVGAVGVGLVALGWISWEIACINKAGRQRHHLIEVIFSRSDYPEMLDAFDAVTFRQHWRALSLFRDPFKLYSPHLTARLSPSHPNDRGPA